jgi:hypothetical protein
MVRLGTVSRIHEPNFDYESVIQLPSYPVSAVNMNQKVPRRSIVGRARQCLPTSISIQSSARQQLRNSSTLLTGQHFVYPLSAPSHDVARNALMHFERAVPEQALSNFTVQELMMRAISQTAVASFEPTSLDVLARDAYIMDECGQLRLKIFVYSESLRYRARHRAFSFRTIVGCLWLRTTTIDHTNEITGEVERSQTVTSIVFYPRRWLQLLGVRNGLEVITASAGRSWLYNCRVTVTRVMPEDSVIFGLCSAGETRAVQMLLEKGQASVVDTSPKGWKPLHVRARFDPPNAQLIFHAEMLTEYDVVCCSGRSY